MAKYKEIQNSMTTTVTTTNPYHWGTINLNDSINCKEKSLKTHKNEGNKLDNSSGSVSVSPLFNLINLDKLITKFKFCKACSSIDPTEL